MAFRFERNSPDLRKILQTEGLEVSRKVAAQILAIVGTEHYEIDEWIGRNRGRVSVQTKPNGKSMGHEAKHHNLIRALAQVGTGSSTPQSTSNLVQYVSKSGRVSMITQAQADNYRRRRA
jgi:hypothetical protein